MSQLEGKLKEFVLSYLREKKHLSEDDSANITDDMDLVASGLLSSLGFIEMISSVEETFKIEIDFENFDPGEFTSLAGFVRLAGQAGGNSR